MHLSTRGRYAVMALLDLAKIQQERGRATPVKLSEVADRQDISLSYLEQLFAQLRREGLVKSVRGPGGGYILAKDESDTWLKDVVKAVDEPLYVTRCDKSDASKGGCVKGVHCNAHNLWMSLGKCVESFMSKVSLKMVIDGDLDFDTGSVKVGANVAKGLDNTSTEKGQLHVRISG